MKRPVTGTSRWHKWADEMEAEVAKLQGLIATSKLREGDYSPGTVDRAGRIMIDEHCNRIPIGDRKFPVETELDAAFSHWVVIERDKLRIENTKLEARIAELEKIKDIAKYAVSERGNGLHEGEAMAVLAVALLEKGDE